MTANDLPTCRTCGDLLRVTDDERDGRCRQCILDERAMPLGTPERMRHARGTACHGCGHAMTAHDREGCDVCTCSVRYGRPTPPADVLPDWYAESGLDSLSDE